jgi:hypothetical protein
MPEIAAPQLRSRRLTPEEQAERRARRDRDLARLPWRQRWPVQYAPWWQIGCGTIAVILVAMGVIFLGLILDPSEAAAWGGTRRVIGR